MKERGIQFFIEALEEVQLKEEKKRKEERIRTQYLQRRGSVVQEYKPINFERERRRNREEEDVNERDFLDNYFLTTEGKKALAEMPEWVFRPKEPHQPAQLDP